MTRRSDKHDFAARPRSPDTWVKDADRQSKRGADPSGHTARLTIDITPELRGRIKVVAFKRGMTVADMLRALLIREYPAPKGDEP